MTTGWQLDTDSAEAYERYLVPAIFEPFARAPRRARRAQRTGERVLDAACGTGVVARYAAPRAGHVVGADVNAGMLAVAARIAPQLEWVQADIAALPFEDGSFDLVLCQQALQFVPDHAAALAELRRVLAPGGHAVVVARARVAGARACRSTRPRPPEGGGLPAQAGHEGRPIRGANNMPGGWLMWQLDQHEVDYKVVWPTTTRSWTRSTTRS